MKQQNKKLLQKRFDTLRKLAEVPMRKRNDNQQMLKEIDDLYADKITTSLLGVINQIESIGHRRKRRRKLEEARRAK